MPPKPHQRRPRAVKITKSQRPADLQTQMDVRHDAEHNALFDREVARRRRTEICSSDEDDGGDEPRRVAFDCMRAPGGISRVAGADDPEAPPIPRANRKGRVSSHALPTVAVDSTPRRISAPVLHAQLEHARERARVEEGFAKNRYGVVTRAEYTAVVDALRGDKDKHAAFRMFQEALFRLSITNQRVIRSVANSLATNGVTVADDGDSFQLQGNADCGLSLSTSAVNPPVASPSSGIHSEITNASEAGPSSAPAPFSSPNNAASTSYGSLD